MNNFRHGLTGTFCVLPSQAHRAFGARCARSKRAARSQPPENRKIDPHKWDVLLAEAKLTHQQVLTSNLELDREIVAAAEKQLIGAKKAA
jgi:hypothetical protein